MYRRKEKIVSQNKSKNEKEEVKEETKKFENEQ